METAKEQERVILVSVQTRQSDDLFDYELQELANLTETVEGEVVAVLHRKRIVSILEPLLVKGN